MTLWSVVLVPAGLAQYSGDPKTEWHLNAHPTKESLLNAVANLPYKGGNTMTGDARAPNQWPPGPSWDFYHILSFTSKKSNFCLRICCMLACWKLRVTGSQLE